MSAKGAPLFNDRPPEPHGAICTSSQVVGYNSSSTKYCNIMPKFGTATLFTVVALFVAYSYLKSYWRSHQMKGRIIIKGFERTDTATLISGGRDSWMPSILVFYRYGRWPASCSYWNLSPRIVSFKQQKSKRPFNIVGNVARFWMVWGVWSTFPVPMTTKSVGGYDDKRPCCVLETWAISNAL